jgi:uncharacterized ion transporter superfamily protein YfcC
MSGGVIAGIVIAVLAAVAVVVFVYFYCRRLRRAPADGKPLSQREDHEHDFDESAL